MTRCCLTHISENDSNVICMHHLWLAVSSSTVYPTSSGDFTCCTIVLVLVHSAIDQEQELENTPPLLYEMMVREGDSCDAVCMCVCIGIYGTLGLSTVFCRFFSFTVTRS